MTPITVITGFLGSGKTTLIARLLATPRLARTAVIVNEFGEIPLDHHLIAAADETLLQLTTGCLCCAIRTDLVDTLLTLATRRAHGEIAFDRVLIETSGLADPAPILHALMTDPALATTFAIARIVTTIDSLLGQSTLATHPEAQRQLAYADHILLTKTDLAPPTPSLRTTLATHNQTAPITIGLPDPTLLFTPTPHTPPATLPRHTKNLTTALIRRTTPVPALALTLLLQSLAEHAGENLLRFKGLFDLAEAPGTPAILHAVQHVISPVTFLPAWPTPDHTSRAVVIGRAIPPHFPARLLDAICQEIADHTHPA